MIRYSSLLYEFRLSAAHENTDISQTRRGFTIRLKRLKIRAPNFVGPPNFWCRTFSSISVRNYTCIFVLVQRTFFHYALTKDLKSRGGQICSIGESFAENQKQQRAAKSVCSVKYSSNKQCRIYMKRPTTSGETRGGGKA